MSDAGDVVAPLAAAGSGTTWARTAFAHPTDAPAKAAHANSTVHRGVLRA